MTHEIDLARVAAVTDRLRRQRTVMSGVADELAGVGRRTGLAAEVAPAVTAAEAVADQIGLAATLLTRRADAARAADVDTSTTRSFAGGTALCSAIQLASPIPSRPSTSGLSGAIDGAAVARDVVSLADAAATAPSTITSQLVPIAALAAAISDILICRLGVGSGAPISTRKVVDDDGDEVYASSRSTHAYLDATGMPLDSDLRRRDRQVWDAEHRNAAGHVTEPYPGYPAYDVNAP